MLSTEQTSLARPQALRHLPVFPAVALQLIDLLEQPECRIDQVSAIVEREPALVVAVLRLANSAAYARRTSCNDIHTAITLVGLEAAKRLALTTAMRGLVGPALRGRMLRMCWEHSLGSALIADLLAKEYHVASGTAYCAGLFHDLGTLVLLALHPREYEELLHWMQEPGFERLAKEREIFGLDHTEAGGWLADHWRLPEYVGAVASGHHRCDPRERSVVGLAAAACQLAARLDLSALPEPPAGDAVDLLRELGLRTDERRLERLFLVRDQVERMAR